MYPQYVMPEFKTNPMQAVASGCGGFPQPLTSGGVKAVGTIVFSANPTDGDTLSLNGVTVTFGAAGDVAVVTSLAQTLTDLAAFLQASVDPLISVATYTVDTTTLTITYDTYAAAANLYAIDVTGLTAAPTSNDATLLGGFDLVNLSLETDVNQVVLTQAVDQYFVLPDGIEGQRKFIYAKTLSGAGTAIITPTNLTGGTTMTFDTVGEYAELRFINGSWLPVNVSAGVVA